MIYAFAFAGDISAKTLYKLKSIDHCYIVYLNYIDHYLNLLFHGQPEFILGLGSLTQV